MRSALSLVFIFLCTSCGGGGIDPSNDNHGYGWHYDAQGTSGLKLRYSPVLAPDDQMARVSTYEAEFAEVQQCTGLTAPSPFVIIVLRDALGKDKNGKSIRGQYKPSPPLLIIEIPTHSFRHEVVHYLLDFSTGDADPGDMHESPLFTRCENGVNVSVIVKVS